MAGFENKFSIRTIDADIIAQLETDIRKYPGMLTQLAVQSEITLAANEKDMIFKCVFGRYADNTNAFCFSEAEVTLIFEIVKCSGDINGNTTRGQASASTVETKIGSLFATQADGKYSYLL